MAHPAIMFSISVSTISITYCFIQLIKKDNKAGNLEKWVRDKYPETYNDLPWVHRKLLKSEVSLNIINNKKLYISLAIGMLGLTFTFINSYFLGWEI